MPENTTATPGRPARLKLEPYRAELRLSSLTPGIDNIHYDVFLSPRFLETARQYLSVAVRNAANLQQFFGRESRQTTRNPDAAQFRKLLTDLLQSGITRAQFEKNIEYDLLFRLAVLKFLTQEISSEFASLVVECKEEIRTRGTHFEHSEQAHVRRAQIAELQSNRKAVVRRVGQSLFHTLKELDETVLAKSRRAMFGEDFAETYEMLTNRLLFVENGNDDALFLEHYVVLGNFLQDPDRFENFDSLMIDFLRDFVITDANTQELRHAQEVYGKLVEQALGKRSELAKLEEEQEEVLRKVGGTDGFLPGIFKRRGGAEAEMNLAVLRRRQADVEFKLAEIGPELDGAKQKVDFLTEEFRNRLGDYLNDPQNARRLFDPSPDSGDSGDAEVRGRLLEEWHRRLEDKDLMGYVLASYEVCNLSPDFCPPVHLQQLRRALLSKDELKRVEKVLSQFPARNFSLKRIEEAAKALRKCSKEDSRAAALRFAQDLMRLRRDKRNYHHVSALMEKIALVRSDRQRELSRANNSLYELVFADERGAADDPVVSHVVIKADVRGSTEITKDLLARGLNPASHFSLTLHEPVKRLLERHGAAKVFLEGDAIILAIYETESNRANQRAVAKACVLAREIIEVTQAYNAKAEASNLPRLELGVGVAFQNSAPSVWSDGESKIMISKALNLSDRLSSCSKMARRIFKENPSPFRVFLLQTVIQGAAEEEGDELLVRFNMNGIEMNEEAFQKLTSEISLFPLEGSFPMPWGKDRAQLYYGELPSGDALEPIVVRRGMTRELQAGGKVGEPMARPYFEVCVHPKLLELARKKVAAVKKA